MMVTFVSAAFAAPAATTTTLTISATSVPYQTPIILTAAVTSGGSPITAGLVLFCDATAVYCENNSALGIAQLTSPGATASVKVGSGPIGSHSYKAVFRSNKSYAASVSNTVTYAVTGTYLSSISLTSTGSIGNYNLTGTVAGVGSLTTGPTGVISFVDTSAGNNVLGTENLVVSTLTTTFAPQPPFAIGGPGATTRSVAIASAYLNADNNLDVVTGDATPPGLDSSTISVLLGNGDGSFQPKVNYQGCTVGSALQILLADFNRDGNTDIALGCSDGTNGGLVIILGNGDGTFQAPVLYSTGDVASISMGDFNGDGLLDIALTDNSQQNVIFFTGNGDGTFTKDAFTISTHAATRGVVVADFNKDGIDDVAYAVATSVPGSHLFDLYVALSNGDGTFNVSPTAVASQIGEFLTSGDTNADDNPDIVSATITRPGPGNHNIGNSLFVLLGNGNGTFQSPVAYVSDIPSDPHLADVNGDGVPDIIAGGSTGALVYIGNGDGTFQPYQEPTIGGFALTYAVNAGDYNNKGNADLIGTDADTPRAAVSLSQVTQTSTASALTSVAVFPLGSGIHNVDASYSGDGIYVASTSSTVPLTAAPVNTSLTLAVSPSTSILSGQPETLTAVLSPYTVGPPTTTTNTEPVNFFSGTTLLGTGTLSAGVATLTTTALPVGADSVTAVYPGDANYNSSTSTAVTTTVSNILLSSSVNPSTYTQSVTFTATVPSGTTGSVTFLDGSTNIGTGVISGTTASLTLSTLSAGSHNITARLGTDTSNVIVQVVNKATPTVTVTTSGASTFGGSVTITASVPAGVTGTISFTSGSLSLGSGTIASGAVSVTTTALAPPSDVITATYSGDSNYNSATGTVTQIVSKASPTSTLTSSVNPSIVNASVTFTDTLPTNVTGTVAFTSGSTALGNATVTNGVATITTASLPVGGDPITATYSGDGNYNSSVATLTQTVNKASPAVTVTTSGASIFGQTVTITASVPVGPTGTITITSGGVTLGSGTITSSNGTVTITTTALPVGSDVITANYGGDALNNSATGTLTQTVTKATPSVALTSSLNPSTFAQSVTFTATLPTNATGTVTFTSGSTVLGTSTLTNGVATVSTSSLPAGSDPITATYNGDTNDNSATGTLTQVVNKATPVVTVTTPGSSTFGNPVTITTTLPVGTTGTVTITSGGVTLGSGSVNPTTGTVTITTTTLPVGSDPITATYGGDTNNNPATGTTTQTVNKATPTVGLTSSLNPSNPGQSVTFTATLPSGPTGTVTFTSGSTVLGTSTLAGGAATIATSSLPPGSDPITATYNGDGNYNSATGSLTQIVNKNTPTVTLTSSLNPSNVGQAVTFTATLPSSATGTVTFTTGSTVLGTSTLTSGTATTTTISLSAGSDPITATYNGDANDNTATGTVTQTVTKATPSVALTSSANPSTFAQSVTFTATLPTNATGTVTFTSGSTALGTATLANGVATVSTSSLPAGSDPITAAYNGDSNDNSATGTLTQVVNKATPVVTVTTPGGSTFGNPVTITTTLPIGTTGTVTITSGGVTLGSGPVNPTTGTVTITTTTLPVGSDPITATYGGDTNNNPATGTTTQTVTKATPTVGLASSLNPSNPGQSVTFTATLPSGPTGTVTFTSGSTVLGTSTLTGGAATIATSSLPSGSDPITATYNGDGNYNSATASLTQTVNKTTPTISVSTSGPSTYGGTVTITTTLPPGTTGTVTITSGGVTLGSGPVNPTTGTVTITTTVLPVGNDPITATYGGDTNNGPATGTTTQTVSKATPTVSLASSLNPSSVNQSVTFTATVPSGATGTITFLDGSTTLGTGTISGGIATFTTSTLNAGVQTITANYGGDTNNNSAASAPLSQTVNKATPVLPIPVVSSSSPTVGAPVTISETVPPGVSGPVTFSNGSTPIGTATIVGGVATITVTTLPLGTDQITASTPGDSNNNPATSPAVSVTVVKTAPTVTVTSSLNPSIINQAVTFTAIAPSGATGTITFFDGTTILGTGTLTNGQATLTTSTLIVGSHTITVSYGGDTNNSPATSVPLTQIVNKATPVIPPPVVSSSNLPTNTPETITETVPSGVTGTVTFSNGSTPLGTATIVGGVATITVPSLPVGTDSITATTSGDANNNPATSPATVVTVTTPNPTLVAPIVSSNNPAPNTPVTITEPIPSGISGPVSIYDGTTLLGTAPVVNGAATLTVPSLPLGSNSITASAVITSTNAPVVSPPTQVTVAKVASVITLTSSVNPSAPAQPVTFAAAVQAGATGVVTFLDGSTVLGTGTINAAGVATFATSTLTIGSHPVTASYGGDSGYNAATSTVLTQVVSRIPTVTTIVASAAAQLLHSGVTFTANVTAPSPNATGTVTFMDGTVVVGTAALSANGGVVVSLTTNANAALATTNLMTGPHQIVAVYSGDNNFAPSTSAPAANMVEDFTNTNTGAASQNIFPGATTTYSFTLAPVGATTFLNDVTVAVAGLPQGSTYTFTPATIAAGSGSTQITLNVQTSSSLSARN